VLIGGWSQALQEPNSGKNSNIIIIIIIIIITNRFTTKDGCAWNVAHNTESVAL
jgi:hypothetical protein